jgi:hypothetical protein
MAVPAQTVRDRQQDEKHDQGPCRASFIARDPERHEHEKAYPGESQAHVSSRVHSASMGSRAGSISGSRQEVADGPGVNWLQASARQLLIRMDLLVSRHQGDMGEVPAPEVAAKDPCQLARRQVRPNRSSGLQPPRTSWPKSPEAESPSNK